MRLKLVFHAKVKDTDDIRGICEQIGMCFEELGDARLISVAPVKGGEPMKVGRGPYKNVMLSDVGYGELVARYGKARAEARIADFSYKLHQKNYKFADHFAVIVEWEEKERGNPSTANTVPLPLTRAAKEAGKATSFDVDEFFNAAVKRGVEG